MGSKKHKKHHKSERRDFPFEDDRPEKPLKLVLKVAGSSSSIQSQNSSAPQMPVPGSAMEQPPKLPHQEERKPKEEKEKSSHCHEKHKKSKKKKKKKSSEKDKDRHDKKRKHHHHHHHHREHSRERKEKRKREQHDLSRSVIESQEDSNLQKATMLEVQASIPLEKPVRDPRSCTLKKATVKSPLQVFLYYILKKLQLKDPQEFFAWPVTDAIAPGYSTIIRTPIDFSTIKKKIDEREYKCVPDFKNDIKLMCDNAMTYNRPDTIYYKSSRRLWHAAQKLMSKDQLIGIKCSLPYLSEVTDQELGFDTKEEAEESFPGAESASDQSTILPEAKKTKVAPNYSAENEDDDFDSPEDILEQAQKAAKAAAEKLTLKKPNSKLGFLRQHENGSTTLSIIHPKGGEKEMKVNLETLTGKLSQGTGTIIGFKEDSKNFVKPITYSTYGAYSSYAPHFDSMFANLNKEESDLVMSTYGDELAVQYADSILTYAKDTDYMMTMVDNLLDVLTGGEHSKTIKFLTERRKMREEEEQALKSAENTASGQNQTSISQQNQSSANQHSTIQQNQLLANQQSATQQNQLLVNQQSATPQNQLLTNQQSATQQNQLLANQQPATQQNQLLVNQQPATQQNQLLANQQSASRKSHILVNQQLTNQQNLLLANQQNQLLANQKLASQQNQLLANQKLASQQNQLLTNQQLVNQQNQLLANQQLTNQHNQLLANQQRDAKQSNIMKLMGKPEGVSSQRTFDVEMPLLQPTEAGKRKIDKEQNKAEMLQKHKKLLTQRRAIQQKLDNATQLLQDLRKVQSERLSLTPPAHLAHVQGPTMTESDLADKVSKKIADIALQLPPESVSSVEGLRKAMGITYQRPTTFRHIEPLPPTTIGIINSKASVVSTVGRPEPSNKQSSTFQRTSPFHAPNDEQLLTADMDTDLQQFLETGPMLRVCESPTGS